LMSFHEPVLLKECIEGLKIEQDGIYVDLTYGGGGHTKAILEKIRKGRVFSFDVDPDAKNNADQVKNPSFTFIQANFPNSFFSVMTIAYIKDYENCDKYHFW